MQFAVTRFIGVIKTMECQPEGQFTGVIESTDTLAEHAGLGIGLAVTRAEENVLPAATLDHTLGNCVVLTVDAVATQFRAMLVPLKVRAYLVFDVG